MVSSWYDYCQRLPLCLYPLGVRKKKFRENNSRKLVPNKIWVGNKKMSTRFECRNEYKKWK